MSSVDPDLGNGELNVRIPYDVAHIIAGESCFSNHSYFIMAIEIPSLILFVMIFFVDLKPIRLSIEFSLEKPQGGIHFVVPNVEGSLTEVNIASFI